VKGEIRFGRLEIGFESSSTSYCFDTTVFHGHSLFWFSLMIFRVSEVVPQLRVLKKDDIPDIIEISKTTWNGHDHLPFIINDWLENSSCHPFVLDQSNKVIAVANVRIIDNGRTAWMEGLRVHSEYRLKGLAERLTVHLVEVAKKLNVKRIRLVTSGDNIAPIKLAAGIGMEPVVEYAVFWKGFRNYPKWSNNRIELEAANSESVLFLMKQHPNLVPLNAIIRHWDIFDATKKKIRELEKTSCFLVGSNELGAVLSLGVHHSTSAGSEWCFSLFATNNDSFLSGLSANLQYADQNGLRNLLCIHLPEYTSLYSKISWLRRRNHELRLILHELVL